MALFRCNKHNISLEEYGIINIGIANVYCSDHKEYKKIENNNSFKYKCTDCLFIGKYKKLINEKCPDCGAKVFQARE
jgi:rRNA maturation endonuclease Nob1